ncbi:hypothetical protein FACS1894166_12950 [Bacilli bacterium]|nr:hypothetical protein FACS1894166_12950 [Bacilli bacterium]
MDYFVLIRGSTPTCERTEAQSVWLAISNIASSISGSSGVIKKGSISKIS